MVLPFKHITQSAQESKELGKRFGSVLLKGEGRGLPVCLWGELGSGKTTFTQGLAQGLGISNRILSPTFIIVRRYTIPNTSAILYHLDLYRMSDGFDVSTVGLDEMLQDLNSIIVIEWPERLGDKLPDKRIDIRFTKRTDDAHSVEGEVHG